MFNSPDQAIRFAFKVKHKTIISQPHNVFLIKEKVRNENREALTAYDFHAQGAMILGFVERQGEMAVAWTYWMYGDPHEKKISARMLADKYSGWGNLGMPRDDIYRAMLSVSVRKCAKELNTTNYKAWKLRRKILDALTPIERGVMDGLWSWMDDHKNISSA
jgi:hypothetical protein